MWCDCKRWKHVIKQLGDAQTIASIHGWKYQGVNHRWNFCPFCGRNLTKRAADECPACSGTGIFFKVDDRQTDCVICLGTGIATNASR